MAFGPKHISSLNEKQLDEQIQLLLEEKRKRKQIRLDTLSGVTKLECRRCPGTVMVGGIAFENIIYKRNEGPNHTKLSRCFKCPKCGHSVTIKE